MKNILIPRDPVLPAREGKACRLWVPLLNQRRAYELVFYFKSTNRT